MQDHVAGAEIGSAFDVKLIGPVLPELLLAIGAMALLMLGAFRGERSTPVIQSTAIALLLVDAVVVLWLPAGTLTTSRSSASKRCCAGSTRRVG